MTNQATAPSNSVAASAPPPQTQVLGERAAGANAADGSRRGITPDGAGASCADGFGSSAAATGAAMSTVAGAGLGTDTEKGTDPTVAATLCASGVAVAGGARVDGRIRVASGSKSGSASGTAATADGGSVPRARRRSAANSAAVG